MALITNEQTTGLSLLDADELQVNPDILSAVNAINASLKKGEKKLTVENLVAHLEANQFYLPQLLFINGEAVLALHDKNIPATPQIEYFGDIAAEAGKPARIQLTIGNEVDQILVSFAIKEGSKVKPREILEKIDPSKYSVKEIIDFLVAFIEPPVQINLPNGDYVVKEVNAETKSTVLVLEGDLKVRVNRGCPGVVTKIRSKDGFIYALSEQNTLICGISIVPRGVSLVSENPETSAKVGDTYTFLGVTSLPTEYGALHTALVVDPTGRQVYTKVNAKVPTLVLTKLSLGKPAIAQISNILTPGGQRKNYDVVWAAVKK